NLMELAEKEMESLCGKDEIGTVPHSTGSTDIGDLSSIMPVIHPYIGGVAGGLHSAEFRIEDEETAYVLNAKMLACIAIELLRVDRVPADSIIRNYQPHFSSMKKYFEYIDSLFKTKVLNERYGQNVFDYI
ncbi:MAG: hypothetical protein ACLFSE_15000, partial [Spirochaetia bacterium]